MHIVGITCIQVFLFLHMDIILSLNSCVNLLELEVNALLYLTEILEI